MDSSAAQILTLHGTEELLKRAGHLFTDVRHEFLCATADPDTWRALASHTRARPRSRGFTARKLSTPEVTGDPAGRRHLTEAAEAGARVRIAGAPLPQEAIVVDRRFALLAGRTGGGRSYTLVTASDVVEGVRALIVSAWEVSREFTPGDGFGAEAPPLDKETRGTLRMLARGYTDERAALRLGVSVRTYRRRIAALMELLGAESRFQLGLRVGRSTEAAGAVPDDGQGRGVQAAAHPRRGRAPAPQG
ncbi:helix-turn-helix transcriptional regulator [Streptomyces xiaopingdaonensis]|uniref:helix-turn-helix transcriptional regulator n=1 Tax=Streptomyces xiaopingdaonensis TaxID=1565415 RepID=UPI0002E57FDB|nr:hypothetical protein [Streptomyces xiaopingdaonensis]